MGWFNNKNMQESSSKVPELPSLPKLPELPTLPANQSIPKSQLPQLPKFPASSFGEKFSQDAIKEAVKGEKEEEGYSDDFQDGTMQLPSRNMTSEISLPKRETRREKIIERRSDEPVFIRLDKFEESLKTFEHTKEKIDEMEKMLKDVRKLREQEEHELEQWETEIQNIKDRIARVDQNIFSKIE